MNRNVVCALPYIITSLNSLCAGHRFPLEQSGWCHNFILQPFFPVNPDRENPYYWGVPSDYNYCHKIIEKAFKKADILCSSVTHAFRGSGARHAQQLDVDFQFIDKIGQWNQTVQHQHYTYDHPLTPVIQIHGHDGRYGFVLPRKDAWVGGVSHSLWKCVEEQVFPWVTKAEIKKTAKRLDVSGRHFLEALHKYGRRVVLEDLADLHLSHPNHPYLAHSPVARHPDFKEFAQAVLNRKRAYEGRIAIALPSIDAVSAGVNAFLRIDVSILLYGLILGSRYASQEHQARVAAELNAAQLQTQVHREIAELSKCTREKFEHECEIRRLRSQVAQLETENRRLRASGVVLLDEATTQASACTPAESNIRFIEWTVS